MKLNTTSKIIAFSIFSLILIFSFTGFYSWHLQKNKALHYLEKSLLDQVHMSSSFFEAQSLDKDHQAELQQMISKLGKDSPVRVTLVDPSGVVLGDSEKTFEELASIENHKFRPEIARALQGEETTALRFSTTVNRSLLYAAVPIHQQGRIAAVLRFALKQSDVQDTLSQILFPTILGLVLGVVLFSLLWFVIFRGFNLQIVAMQQHARNFAHGDLTKKIPLGDFEELNSLANVMNRMAASLQSRIRETENEKLKMRAILNNMQEGVMAIGSDQQIMLANPSACLMFGCTETSSEGKSLIEMTHSQNLDLLCRKAIEESSHQSDEVQINYPSPRSVKINVVGVSKNPEEICALIVMHDITELRKLENLRTDFVANVSHELKTPLTSIKGFIETLLGGAARDPEKTQEFLQMMDEDCNRLTRLIHELLDLSNIESGKMPLQLIPVSLPETVEKVLTGFGAQIKGKNIQVSKQFPKDLPKVTADKDKLHQILVNLIDNAVKFNRDGGSLKVSARKSGSVYFIDIEDSGIGIPESAAERVFERFFRVDKARSRALGGTGLGLAIVKHLVEAQGGTVSCQSALGKGSVFSFSLPTA